MIKIESVNGKCSIMRNGEECVLFVGMCVYDGELETLKGGEVTYTVDEGEVQTAVPAVQAPVAPAAKPAPAAKTAA